MKRVGEDGREKGEAGQRNHVMSAKHSRFPAKAIKNKKPHSTQAVSRTTGSTLMFADGLFWNSKY